MHREFLTKQQIITFQFQNALRYLEEHRHSPEEAVQFLSWAFFTFLNEATKLPSTGFWQKLDENPELEEVFTNPDFEPQLGRTLLAFLKTYVSNNLESILEVLDEKTVTAVLSHPSGLDQIPKDTTDIHLSHRSAASYNIIKELTRRFPIQVISVSPSVDKNLGPRNRKKIKKLLETESISYIVVYTRQPQQTAIETTMLE